MPEPINIGYRFLSTGTLDFHKASDSEINTAQQVFSRLIGSLKQIKQHSEYVSGCIIDFRLLYDPTDKSSQKELIKCFLTFSFKINGISESETRNMHDDLKKYCETLLTFTLRQQNFTIEPDDDGYDYERVKHIVEVLRPADIKNKNSKLSPETLKTPINVKKLANLMLRSQSPIGYSVMLNLHGWTENEVSLIMQGGIQSEDPYSKIGAYFAGMPEDKEEEHTTSSAEKPVCKIRFFSTEQLSQFFLSELLGCISPGFLKTIKVESKDKGFSHELQEIKYFQLAGESSVRNTLDLEPLILKVYRSLSTDEIADVCPVPRESFPGIRHKKYKTLYPSIDELSHTGILIGHVRTEASTQYIDVRISDADRLRHCYIIGQTGTGKSSLIASMVIQDILSEKSSILIDPHGELCDDIIGAVPEKCLDNIVLIDPSKSAEYSGCSLNILDIGSVRSESDLLQKKDYWINELTSMFISLYGSEVFGPRIQEYFRVACLTLMDSNIKATLLDLPRLFTDRGFLEECRKKITDPDAKEMWDVVDKTADKELQEILPYFSSKFSPLVRSYMIRNFIGSKHSLIDLEKFISEGKTVLVRLSKGDLGELGMRLIGMLVMSRLKALVFARSKIEPEKRKFVALYVDEFQNFISEGFQTLLSEARKFGLGLVLAHQYLTQMSQAQFQLYGSGGGTRLLDAILGNVGNILTFRIGAKDAEQILPSLGSPSSEVDLTNLENYQFICRILNSGTLSSPMTVQSFRNEFLDYPTLREEQRMRVKYLMEMFKI